ncbi:PH domain-containing protein [Lysinibacter cavernae]|uniref:YdbS-like PH domain-containing protein n=1 Tax=Lysinibacter cavernae TaxID=1640652 RepID=A0A7X5TV20_9MICO|nr:PH domain-containing protein [Lysinibacter cavernae]NIH54277.1 hypothetical protein [Lysinibacter cavernae]
MTDHLPAPQPLGDPAPSAVPQPRAISRGLNLPVSQGWQRVSGRYVVVELISNLIGWAVLVVVSLLPLILDAGWGIWQTLLPIAVAVVGIVACAITPRRVRAIGYQLRADDFLFRRGIFSQRIVAVPYGRMQIVDINRGPIVRALGLAELKFVTAAAATGVTLPGLKFETAESLRDHLIAVAETRRSGL